MKTKKSFFAIAVALILTFLGCFNNSQGQNGVHDINQEEFSKILQKENAIIIDVRTPEEVSAGYIKGATVFADVNGRDFEAQIDKLDKSKAYIVYCKSGKRSSKAAKYMVNKGFKKVYNLKGGISEWKGEIVKP